MNSEGWGRNSPAGELHSSNFIDHPSRVRPSVRPFSPKSAAGATMPRPAGRVTVDRIERMSITPILAAAAQPAASPVTEIAGWAVLILLLPGLAAAVYLRVYRPNRAAGPLRVPPGRPVWPLVCAWLAGGTVWMGASTAFVVFKQFELTRVAGPNARFNES